MHCGGSRSRLWILDDKTTSKKKKEEKDTDTEREDTAEKKKERATEGMQRLAKAGPSF